MRPRLLIATAFVAALIVPLGCATHHAESQPATRRVTHTTNTTVAAASQWITVIGTGSPEIGKLSIAFRVSPP